MHASHEAQLRQIGSVTGESAAAHGHDAERLRSAVSLDGWSPLWTGLARLGGVLPPAGHQDADSWALLRGWKHPPGGGRADGRLVRRPGRDTSGARPRFDAPIPPGGYGWWYVDGISEDGRYGLTIIAFLGSVFSPYYKKSGRDKPLDHCALNVALYGPRARWCMTERSQASVCRTADELSIGASSVRWNGDALEFDIVEQDKRLGVPWQRVVRGKVTLRPEVLNHQAFSLDPQHKPHLALHRPARPDRGGYGGAGRELARSGLL